MVRTWHGVGLGTVHVNESYIYSSLDIRRSAYAFVLALAHYKGVNSLVSGYEQTLLERSGCTTKGQVLHTGEGSTTDICCLCEGQN